MGVGWKSRGLRRFPLDIQPKHCTVSRMLTIRKGAETLSFKSWLFPDGAIGIRLDTDNHRYRSNVQTRPTRPDENRGFAISETKTEVFNSQTITARIQSSRDLMELVMVTDALREWDPTPIHLVLPYLPYGRQDRRCVKGESFSLRAFARLINGLGFARVTIFDAHSDVSAAVLDNVKVIDQSTIIGRFDALNKRLHAAPQPVFVSPDAGANKRVSDLAALYGHTEFIRADKLRDLATGRIKETVVYGEAMVGRDVIIPDDLADGGASFVALAAVLKAKGASRVELYVTHGVFSRGLAPLFAGGIDHVWTTNSFQTGPFYWDLPDETGSGTHATPARFTALNLEDAFTL